GRLSHEENRSLPCRLRKHHVAGASKTNRIAHRKAGAPAKELDCPLQVRTLVVKVVEQAARHRAAAAAEEEVGVTLWRQMIRERSKDAVGLIGLEDVTDGDRVGRSRAPRDDSPFRQPRARLSKPDLYAAGERLLLQGRVECARGRSTT